MSRSLLIRADGVVGSISSQICSEVERTTPSAVRRLRSFLLMPQPPLLVPRRGLSLTQNDVCHGESHWRSLPVLNLRATCVSILDTSGLPPRLQKTSPCS